MKILLAVDGSACSEAAVDAVIHEFQSRDAEVRVVHAVEWLKDMPISFRFGEGTTAVNDILAYRDHAFLVAHHLVADIARRLETAGFRTSTETPDEDPRHAILTCADHWHPDLIVMGSHGKSGWDRMLLGSVSESVLRHAGRSVQIVRMARAA